MRHSIANMFRVMLKLNEADPEISARLQQITETVLMPDTKRTVDFLDQAHDPEIMVKSPSCRVKQPLVTPHSYEVTPVNITLLSEIFRFVAHCPYKVDAQIESCLKKALDYVLPAVWPRPHAQPGSHNEQYPFRVCGFHNNEKTRALLIKDICQSIIDCLAVPSNSTAAITTTSIVTAVEGQGVHALLKHHLNNKQSFLITKYSQEISDDTMVGMQDYLPLLQAVSSGRNSIFRKFMGCPDQSKWPLVVRVLRHLANADFLTQQDIEELMAKCLKNLKDQNSQFDSLALLLKMSFIQKHQSQQQELTFFKIMIVYLLNMLDRERPAISMDQLAQVLNMLLKIVGEELAVNEREALLVIGELLDVVSVFCQNGGLTEMNKNQLLPQLSQIQRRSQQDSARDPLYYLFLHTRHSCIFEDFVCGLIQKELDHNRMRNWSQFSYESTTSYKFITRVTQFTADQPRAASITFLVRMMQVVGMQAPAGLLSRFVVCLKKEDSDQPWQERAKKEQMEYVLGYLVASTDDIQGLMDEYDKTFRRKRLMWLFVPATVKIFGQLQTLPHKITFLGKASEMLQYIQQQSAGCPAEELQTLLETLIETFKPVQRADFANKVSKVEVAEFKTSLLKIWFILAPQKQTELPSLQPCLIQLASLTPVFVFDAEFQVQVRAHAKPQELESFSDQVFTSFEVQVSSKSASGKQKRTSHGGESFQLDESHYANELNASDEIARKSLTNAERVFLAFFVMILRFKIQAAMPPTDFVSLGSSFVEQVVAMYQEDGYLHEIPASQQTQEQITAAKLEVINTQFGLELEDVTKKLVVVHVEKRGNDWSEDFSSILINACSHCWAARKLFAFMSPYYLYQSECLSLKVIQTYCQLLNALQTKLADSYSCLPSLLELDESRTLKLPVDLDLMNKIQADLQAMLTQQYISSCLLGNRTQVDFIIQQVIKETSLSTCFQSNLGERCLQSLLQLQIQLDLKQNTNQLLQDFRNAPHLNYFKQVQQVYQKCKSVATSFAVQPTRQNQTKLPQTRAYGDLDYTRLETNLKLKPFELPQNSAFLQDPHETLTPNFDDLLLKASQTALILQILDKVDYLQTRQVKRSLLFDLLSSVAWLEKSALIQKVMAYYHHPGATQYQPDYTVNFILNNLFLVRFVLSEVLENRARQLTQITTSEIQVAQLVQIVANIPEILMRSLLYLHSFHPKLMPTAIHSYELGAKKHAIPQPRDYKKQVGHLKSPTKKSIRGQVSVPTTLAPKEKESLLIEQYHVQYPLNIEVVQYLQRLGYHIGGLAAAVEQHYGQLLRTTGDLYTQLLMTRVLLESGGLAQAKQANLVCDLCLQILGKQFKSTEIGEVTRWVQLIADIKHLLPRDETILQYLLSHFKIQLISWNFQQMISQGSNDDSPPSLSSKHATKFVQRWPKLAIKLLSAGGVSHKFVEAVREALKDQVWSKPELFMGHARALDLYLKKKEGLSKLLCNLWRTDEYILNLRALSMRHKNDLLECQLAIKALDVAQPKEIIFVLPQLFQSLRIDKKIGNLIVDFLIRQSLKHVSVAHNVLWFCKVECIQPGPEEQKNRKVPLPVQKEELPQITKDLFTAILAKLDPVEQQFFHTETDFFEKITGISGFLKASMSKDEKKKGIKEHLEKHAQSIPDCVYFPTNPQLRVTGIVTTSGMPMQSAARVPISITFEVEDYQGPDAHLTQQRTDYLRSLMSQEISFDQEMRDKISGALDKFSQYWVPIMSEEDVHDDEDYNLNECEGGDHIHGVSALSKSVKANLFNTYQNYVARQMSVNRSMFSASGATNIGQRQQAPINARKQLLTSNEQKDQMLFMKQIKDATFKTGEQQRMTGHQQSTFALMKNLYSQQRGDASTVNKLQRLPKLDNMEPITPKNQLINFPTHPQQQHSQPQQHQPSAVQKTEKCIFKVNDDLRQDILALQFIKHFQKIFKACQLDLYVYPYQCISNRTGSDNLLGGIIEVVPNSFSRDALGKAFEINLHAYFLKKYKSESSIEFQNARYNFIKSLAAYAVVSFILQIKDRHNGNILIDEEGHLIHIDFGFIFDFSPGGDMKFESAAFKMTQEFTDVLGGSPQAPAYRLFEQMVIQGYLAVREHSQDFLAMTELMLYSGFPCFKPKSLQNLEQRFMKELSPAEAAVYMRGLISAAAKTKTTNLYDMFQYKSNKVYY